MSRAVDPHNFCTFTAQWRNYAGPYSNQQPDSDVIVLPFCHPTVVPLLPLSCLMHVLPRAAEEEAAKAAAAEAKKAREAEKKVIKKQRQLLRSIAEGQQQERLLSEGGCNGRCLEGCAWCRSVPTFSHFFLKSW